MFPRLIELYKWALDKGYEDEATAILKLSAGNPLPINRAQVEDIVDELLDEFMAKMLAYGISPLDMLSVIAGQVRLPEDLALVLASTTVRRQDDVTKERLTIHYQLQFSDNPHLPQGQAGGVIGDPRRVVVLGVNPSPGLIAHISQILDRFPRLGNLRDWDRLLSLPQQLTFFRQMIRGYLIETLRHEEVHARDVLYSHSKQGEVYTITRPGGESLSDISNAKQVDLRSLFINNLTHIATHPLVNISIDIMRIVGSIASGGGTEALERELDELFASVKDIKLQPSIEIFIPARGESQVLAKNGETLRAAGKRLQVDPIRLLVINYNDLFAKVYDVPFIQTYQEIFDLPEDITETILDRPILGNNEIKIIPNYSELYSFDRGFYLLTREESKAHYEQIIYQLEQATNSMSKTDISNIGFKDMLKMSSLIKDYTEAFKKNPVDEIVKTPIYGKTIAQLKDERYRDFINRMHTHWSNNFRDVVKDEDD